MRLTILSKPTSKGDYDRKLNMGINITESYYSPSQQKQNTGPSLDELNYNVYKQRYYGRSREER